MSKLLLIRHGQASFGTANYDKLSELGIAQSRRLGEYWAERKFPLDAAITGAQERQRDTALAVRNAYRAKGLPFPEISSSDCFNEYDARGIMTLFFPKLAESNQRIKDILARSTGLAQNGSEGRKAFQQVFEIVVDHWVRGEFESDHVESWEHFKGRVVSGIVNIMKGFPSGKTVAVFTSGGPISAAMRHVLGTSDNVGINLSWVIKNASVTEFMYSGDKITLTGFNMTPQFRDDAMITYR